MVFSITIDSERLRCRKCSAEIIAASGSIFQDEMPSGLYMIAAHDSREDESIRHLVVSLFDLENFGSPPVSLAFLVKGNGLELEDWTESPWENISSLGKALRKDEASASRDLDRFTSIAKMIVSHEDLGKTEAIAFSRCMLMKSDFEQESVSHDVPKDEADMLVSVNLGYIGMPGCFEILHGRRLEQGACRILSVPFFARNLALDDIAAIDEAGNYAGTLERSGQITMRIAIDPECDHMMSLHECLHAILEKEGVIHEWHQIGYGAASVADQQTLARVGGILESLWEKDPNFFFEVDEADMRE